jgi:hypothetical protein
MELTLYVLEDDFWDNLTEWNINNIVNIWKIFLLWWILWSGGAKYLEIRGQSRGHNDTTFGRPTPGQPIGCPGVGYRIWWFKLLLISNIKRSDANLRGKSFKQVEKPFKGLQCKISFEQVGNLKRRLMYHPVDGREAGWQGGTVAGWHSSEVAQWQVKWRGGSGTIAGWQWYDGRVAGVWWHSGSGTMA